MGWFEHFYNFNLFTAINSEIPIFEHYIYCKIDVYGMKRVGNVNYVGIFGNQGSIFIFGKSDVNGMKRVSKGNFVGIL